MKQRGKKGAGLGLVVSALPQRLEPPDTLSDDEATVWRRIVNALPAGHFQPADAELLRAFVTACVMHDEAKAMVNQHGMMMVNERGTPVANPMLSTMQSQAQTMKALATSLRLSPQSRYSEKAAATKAVQPADKPWQVASA